MALTAHCVLVVLVLLEYHSDLQKQKLFSNSRDTEEAAEKCNSFSRCCGVVVKHLQNVTDSFSINLFKKGPEKSIQNLKDAFRVKAFVSAEAEFLNI